MNRSLDRPAVATSQKRSGSSRATLTHITGGGFVYSARGDDDNGINDFTQVIRLNPGDSKTYRSRGCVHGTKGYFTEAVQDFTEGNSLSPNWAEVYVSRGTAFWIRAT